MGFVSRFRARRKWGRATKDSFAQIKALSGETITGLRELERIRITLNHLFAKWQLAKIDRDERAEGEAIARITALQDRSDVLFTRDAELRVAITGLQMRIMRQHVPLCAQTTFPKPNNQQRWLDEV